MSRFMKACLIGLVAGLAYVLFARWRESREASRFARPATPYEPLRRDGA